jgi:SAM-dependent methyltransferase
MALLAESGHRVTAFSRRRMVLPGDRMQWRQLSVHTPVREPISHWISLVPIWVLPEYGDWIKSHGATRLVALSSTSCLVKQDSTDPGEREVARELLRGESFLCAWGKARKVDWIVLRPTLIYGAGNDKNISEIVSIVDRLGFFPLMGNSLGKRQPVHAQDVAAACLSALGAAHVANRSYNLPGGETLTYRDMVARVFEGLGRRPVMPCLPGWMFRFALNGVRMVPRYRHWTMAMVQRMNQDLVFDSSEARRDFGYAPRKRFQIPEISDRYQYMSYLTKDRIVLQDDKAYFCYLNSRSKLSVWFKRYLLYPYMSRYVSGRVLDLGCGIGDYLRYNKNAVGADINKFSVAHCKEKGCVAYLIEDGRLPFEDQAFDSVILDNVLEHLPNPDEVVDEIFRVSRNGAVLLVGVPGKKGYLMDPDHKIFYDEEKMNLFLDRYGYHRVKIFYFPFFLKSGLSSRVLSQYTVYGVYVKTQAS